MNPLSAYPDGVRDVYDACVSEIADVTLNAILTGLGDKVEAAGMKYETLAKAGILNEYSADEFAASPDELKAVGDLYRIPLRDGRKRGIYDKFMALAPRGVCPQCGVNRVRTLDHYLPQSKFRELAIVVHNLVPVCRDCNTDKGTFLPKTADECIFHPYFDDWSWYSLLQADVVYTPIVAVKYRIDSSSAPTEVVNRARTHFRVLHLGELYSTHAGTTLKEVKANCVRSSAKGRGNVHEYLQQQWNSASVLGRNHWKLAMWKAIVSDSEFADGNYLLI